MDTLERGIIPYPFGGMGNQMFIISAAYVAHKVAECPLYLLQPLSTKNPHNKKSRNYNKSLFKYFGKHLPFSMHSAYFIDSLNYIIATPSCFDVWHAESVLPGTMFRSYFQYYPPLARYEDVLRKLFVKGLADFPLKDYSDCAFLHVRRGDYLRLTNCRQLTDDYYREAVKFLPNVRKIMIISNDPDWVKEQAFFKDPLFEEFVSDDELETMALMSKCTAGAICANSTYSWWGAFLGAYGSRNPVVVPRTWFFKDDVPADLFPKEWITV
jgi:hypothetical protein